MNKAITSDTLIAILEKVSLDIEHSQDYLTDLDSALGDGDHGVSMTIGFRSIRKALPELQKKGIDEILYTAGMRFQAAAGATVGALVGSALMKTGKELKGTTEIGIVEMDRALQTIKQHILALGKARLGDKTMVDAIVPASKAFSKAAGEGKSTLEALEFATEAARKGMESTKDMISKIGRASRLGERSRGHQDPGATSCYLVLKSVVEYLMGRS